jgi:hypothetical protein
MMDACKFTRHAEGDADSDRIHNRLLHLRRYLGFPSASREGSPLRCHASAIAPV